MSTPAVKRSNRYVVTRATWRGIDLEIRHFATWSKAAGIDHIEVISDHRKPLPITETGYKSLFIMPEYIAEKGTAQDYVLAWLDHEAKSRTWKRYQADTRQLSLF
jgi:hypothetical protein